MTFELHSVALVPIVKFQRHSSHTSCWKASCCPSKINTLYLNITKVNSSHHSLINSRWHSLHSHINSKASWHMEYRNSWDIPTHRSSQLMENLDTWSIVTINIWATEVYIILSLFNHSNSVYINIIITQPSLQQQRNQHSYQLSTSSTQYIFMHIIT